MKHVACKSHPDPTGVVGVRNSILKESSNSRSSRRHIVGFANRGGNYEVLAGVVSLCTTTDIRNVIDGKANSLKQVEVKGILLPDRLDVQENSCVRDPGKLTKKVKVVTRVNRRRNIGLVPAQAEVVDVVNFRPLLRFPIAIEV